MARSRPGDRPRRRPRRFGSLDESARRRGRRAAATVLLVAGLIGLVSLVVAPALRVRHVDVVGTHRLTAARVVAAAGLEHPGSVLMVDPGSLEARVDSSTWVRSSHVTPVLPDRITIQVDEWEPVAVYRAGGGAPFDLSDQAVALGAATAQDAASLLAIDGPAKPAPKAGRAAMDRGLLTALVNVQRALPGLIGQDVKGFALDGCGNLTMTAARGWTVQFGRVLTPEEVASLHDKVASLKALSVSGGVDFNNPSLQYVNVMNPAAVAVKSSPKPARGSTAASPSPAPAPTATPAPAACR